MLKSYALRAKFQSHILIYYLKNKIVNSAAPLRDVTVSASSWYKLNRTV